MLEVSFVCVSLASHIILVQTLVAALYKDLDLSKVDSKLSN